jgi:RNA recognition motif-containing protein
MDDSQTAFATQYQSYAFDLDMMKRSMEPVGGPDAKKARWSPTSAFSGQNGNSAAGNNNRDAFANYGYGPQAAIAAAGQNAFNNQQAAAVAAASMANGAGGFGGSPLYSTPSLTVNTQSNGGVMGSQLSPNAAAAVFAAQQQQQQQQQGQGQAQPQGSPNGGYNAFNAYSMLGMGMPGMGMLGAFPYNGQMGNFGQNFGQQRMPSLNMNMPNAGAGAYSPVALTAAMGASGNVTGRTVYVGNLPATASVDELLNLVHFGPLESIRVLPEKSCVFLSFLDGATAAAFHADATVKKLSLHGQELKIGWGKPSPVPAQVALAISQSNASRNVYLGGLDENMTEEQLRDELSRFGLIDQVKIVRDKNIGFVHFLSISIATKVVNTLPTEPAWAGKRVNYGKDRCAYVPKSQQVAAQQAQAAAAQSLVAQQAVMTPAQANFPSFPAYPTAPFNPVDMMAAGNLAAANGMGGVQGLNRTVYLGNIHPETTSEDLCNAIRGGVLQSIRYMQDKHIAFVTFVDPAAAFTFFQVASYQGLTLNNRRLKIGWGKNSGPLPPTLALAVHGGATRNVYIGNIEDFETWTEERLKRDFGEYGDIELVNFLKEKNCAFVNFTNISNAIKAIDGVKNKPEYANLRIAHGKDRCANPPRSGPQGGGGGMKRNVSGNGATNGTAGLDGANGELHEDDGVLVNGVEDELAGGVEMHVDGTNGIPAAA